MDSMSFRNLELPVLENKVIGGCMLVGHTRQEEGGGSRGPVRLLVKPPPPPTCLGDDRSTVLHRSPWCVRYNTVSSQSGGPCQSCSMASSPAVSGLCELASGAPSAEDSAVLLGEVGIGLSVGVPSPLLLLTGSLLSPSSC